MDFSTSQSTDFQWPFPKPVVGKPCEPPSPDAKPTVRPAPVAPYCHCDAHSYSPRVEQYKQLLEKEQKLCQDYEQLRRQYDLRSKKQADRALRTREWVHQSYYKIKSYYKLATVPSYASSRSHVTSDLPFYVKTCRLVCLNTAKVVHKNKENKMEYLSTAFPVSDYREIIAASQSSAPIPMEANSLGILRCYKDPTHFTDQPPVVRPTIHPPGVIHTGVAPRSIQTWFTEYPGRTEYMDTYSATAKACLRSMQRYKEPMPSTRRRADDTCI